MEQTMDEFQKIADSMDPEAAISKLTSVARNLLAHVGDEARLKFVMDLIGDTDKDKASGLVHL